MSKVFAVVLQANDEIAQDDASVVAVCRTRVIAERWVKTTHRQILKEEQEANPECTLEDIQNEWVYNIDEVSMVTK